MIQIIVTYTCSRCESPNIARNGHDYKGSQKYHCKDCGRYGTLNAQQGYDASIQAQVKRGVLERLSLRGMERMVSISRRTIHRWLTRWIEAVPPVETSLVPANREDVLELDELWSFVGSKQQQRWVWLALCRRTR
jgi:transposase-like protein